MPSRSEFKKRMKDYYPETVEDMVVNAIGGLAPILQDEYGWSLVEANTLVLGLLAVARPKIQETEAEIAAYNAKHGTA